MNGRISLSNKRSAASTGGFRNQRTTIETSPEDFYATDPIAVHALFDVLPQGYFRDVWECACGNGTMAEALREHGVLRMATDIVFRGYWPPKYEHWIAFGRHDFLSSDKPWPGDIVTNPPYILASQFIERALQVIDTGRKAAFFLPIRYLEGSARYALFTRHPLFEVYISVKRIRCAINGDFARVADAGAVAYAWFVWQKGFAGRTTLKWFNYRNEQSYSLFEEAVE